MGGKIVVLELGNLDKQTNGKSDDSTNVKIELLSELIVVHFINFKERTD